MNMQQLRPWLYASVVAALVLSIGVSQIDTHKIYQQLQTQLEVSGITLQADKLSLSVMYTGSIRLDNVHLQSETFEADAQHLFIDLNLAALLTGEAVPQAIYLQFSDINVIQNHEQGWLTLLQNDTFKLKRINIARSEIHFEQQHLTLESVDLDIRDIGKNRNPRMELQANIGEGRIDAHGYLRLKHESISRGFGRISLTNIPLNNWQHNTTLETLSGSITSHLNKDKTWQSFGHITLQKDNKDAVEMRAKILGGEHGKFLSIQDVVFNHKEIGAVQVEGECVTKKSCAFTIQSSSIKLQPLLTTLHIDSATDGKLKDTEVKLNLNDGHWVSYAKTTWDAFDYNPNPSEKSSEPIRIFPATLNISDFDWRNKATWNIHKLTLSSPTKTEIDIDKVAYREDELILPITLHDTAYWLPISQWLWQDDAIQGLGTLDGSIQIKLNNSLLTQANIQLNADNIEIQTRGFNKPQGVALSTAGKLLWKENKLPSFAELSLSLADSTFKLRQEASRWYFSDLDVDFDQFKEVGIQLPKFWQTWHGYIRGATTLHIPENNIIIEHAEIDLIQFGKDRHYVDGQIITDGTLWDVEHLSWTQDKNQAEFFGGKNNQFDIIAESLDAQALALLQSLPFSPHGKLTSKAMRLPFGTLSDVSASYQTTNDALTLKSFKSKLYEGTLHAEQVDVFTKGTNVAMQGTIQVGGIHLNNWLWLHKQFDTHLQATVYATLNLHGEFDEKQQLSAWKGDGDVSIYNGVWLFNNKNIKADKLDLKLRKRKEFNTTFNVKDGKLKGAGTLRIDEQKHVSGQLEWLDKTYTFSKTWPKFRFHEAEPSSEVAKP